MLSTLSQQADTHLKLPAWADHVTPRSPLLVCYQTSDQHVGNPDWQMFESAVALKGAGKKEKQPSQQTFRTLLGKMRCLFTHRSAAESGDVIFLSTSWPRLHLTASVSCFLYRLHFTLRKKTVAMSVTVSPCGLTIEWSLSARTLKDKPFTTQCERIRTSTSR